MRWIVALVTAACLWAAGGGRSAELRAADRQVAQLAAASGGLVPHLAPRRDGARGELRLPAFTVPACATLGEPPRVVALDAHTAVAAIAGVAPVAPRARGPPVG